MPRPFHRSAFEGGASPHARAAARQAHPHGRRDRRFREHGRRDSLLHGRQSSAPRDQPAGGRCRSAAIELEAAAQLPDPRAQGELGMHSPRPVRQRLMSIMLLTSAATLAQIIAANSTAALAFRDERGAYDVLASLRSEPSITAAVLYDQDGTIFVRYSADETKHRAPARAGPDGFAFASGYLEGFEPVR